MTNLVSASARLGRSVSESSGTGPGGEPGDSPTSPSADANVTIDTTTRHQTIVGGWEAVAQGCHFECRDQFPAYAEDLYETAVDDLGFTQLRLEVRSGTENPEDHVQRFIDGEISFQEWKQEWYVIVNDNDDPGDIDLSGFQF